eukprot:gene4333-4754_t
MNPKEAAQKLLARAREEHVRFPTVMTESQLMQTCGAALMLRRSEEGFDIEAALADIIAKHGQTKSSTPVPQSVDLEEEEEKEEEKEDKKPKRKRKAKEENDADSSAEGGEEGEGEGKKAKAAKRKAPVAVKKTEIVAVEENRPVAEAVLEMAKIYFENKEARKGGVFSKAAKALRDCDHVINSAKEAQKLPGIGKGIAGYIEEFLTSGSIKKLEELRAGIA